jgi:hypothetical protein
VGAGFRGGLAHDQLEEDG